MKTPPRCARRDPFGLAQGRQPRRLSPHEHLWKGFAIWNHAVLLAEAGGIVHSDAMSPTAEIRQSSARFVRLSQLRKLCECEQVAAVCYRVQNGAIEFLLVRTRGGERWIFPKGSAEAGLTHAQAAALEAFEEAGVHGRIEEASFARYRRKRGDGKHRASRSADRGVAVNAYLCEVLRLSPPQEFKRDRTWFSVEDARRRLREGRKNASGAEFVRVIDRAVGRIQQLRGRLGMVDRPQTAQQDRRQLGAPPKDALQRVPFDFAEAYGRAGEASFMPHIRRQLDEMRRSAAPIVDAHSREVLPCEVLEFGSTRERKSKALGAGTKTG
jgi:8-oxo-dGTP pyrophosphatase MutT (NUDIX family)